MDLENYKKAWTNQPEEKNKVSAVEIYKMAHANSSSIVKWIFIIGILEFVILNSMYFFFDFKESKETFEKVGLENTFFYSQILSYVVLVYFLYQFYLNYKNISVLSSTKNLLTKIVKTRKTVRNYIIFNLVYMLIFMVVFTITMINSSEFNFNPKQTAIFIGFSIVITTIMIGLIFLFYQLLYGILLRKLKKNYKEISKLEELN